MKEAVFQAVVTLMIVGIFIAIYALGYDRGRYVENMGNRVDCYWRCHEACFPDAGVP